MSACSEVALVLIKRCCHFLLPIPEPFATKEYDELIPNSFVREPSRLSMFGKRAIVHVRSSLPKFDYQVILRPSLLPLKQGLAFIATADIANEEELFLNYR